MFGNILKSIRESVKEEGLFDNVIGLEREKTLLNQALNAKKAVHVILNGPPSTAKSLLMNDIKARMKPKDYVYIVGSLVSKQGISKILFERKPKYIFIDEFQYISKKDQSVLLSLMGEDGIVSETYAKGVREGYFETRVFATTNSISNMIPALLTRFLLINIKQYTKEQFIEICRNVMSKTEGIPSNIAIKVAEQMYNHSITIRECIKVGRLCRNEEDIEPTIKNVLAVSQE